jgi:hypothetical protein
MTKALGKVAAIALPVKIAVEANALATILVIPLILFGLIIIAIAFHFGSAKLVAKLPALLKSVA